MTTAEVTALDSDSIDHVLRTVVVLNPKARGGRGRTLWAAVERAVSTPRSVIEFDREATWPRHVATAVRHGARVFVAAGGDGTVNALLNAVIDSRGSVGLADFTLGAVGLGSSNDFHRPFARRVSGVPVRLDVTDSRPRDVGRVIYTDMAGTTKTRYFIVAASLGFVATANDFFNRGDHFLRGLKRWWTGAAILYAAVRTLVVYRNLEVCLNGRATTLTNLSVQKTPFVGGGFMYDTPVAPDDRRFSINLVATRHRRGTLRVFLGLLRGRFRGRPSCHAWQAAHLEVRAASPFMLELDGEVVIAHDATFDVLPEQINVCA